MPFDKRKIDNVVLDLFEDVLHYINEANENNSNNNNVQYGSIVMFALDKLLNDTVAKTATATIKTNIYDYDSFIEDIAKKHKIDPTNVTNEMLAQAAKKFINSTLANVASTTVTTNNPAESEDYVTNIKPMLSEEDLALLAKYLGPAEEIEKVINKAEQEAEEEKKKAEEEQKQKQKPRYLSFVSSATKRGVKKLISTLNDITSEQKHQITIGNATYDVSGMYIFLSPAISKIRQYVASMLNRKMADVLYDTIKRASKHDQALSTIKSNIKAKLDFEYKAELTTNIPATIIIRNNDRYVFPFDLSAIEELRTKYFFNTTDVELKDSVLTEIDACKTFVTYNELYNTLVGDIDNIINKSINTAYLIVKYNKMTQDLDNVKFTFTYYGGKYSVQFTSLFYKAYAISLNDKLIEATAPGLAVENDSIVMLEDKESNVVVSMLDVVSYEKNEVVYDTVVNLSIYVSTINNTPVRITYDISLSPKDSAAGLFNTISSRNTYNTMHAGQLKTDAVINITLRFPLKLSYAVAVVGPSEKIRDILSVETEAIDFSEEVYKVANSLMRQAYLSAYAAFLNKAYRSIDSWSLYITDDKKFVSGINKKSVIQDFLKYWNNINTKLAAAYK